MKISLLNENSAGVETSRDYLAEWGLSLFIQIGGVNILFDTGHTNVWQHNAKVLGLDLNTSDFVVLSHHHWDHTGGLRFHNFKTQKKIIFHPDVLTKMPPEEAGKIKKDFEVITSATPVEFSKNIFYLGEIPRQSTFEKGMYKNDPMTDDSAMVIKTAKGAVVVTGCSHAGISNICEYAKKVSGQKLYAVLGGFHLFEDDPQAIKGTVAYFKKEKPAFLYPMHCVDPTAMAAFYTNLTCKKYLAGDVFEIDET